MTLEEKVDRALALLIEIERRLPARTPAATTEPVTERLVATGRELDGKYGDPQVRRDPPRWDGSSYKGKPYSACPPDYLVALAGFLDWQAQRDDEKGTEDSKKYAAYARRDAARCRGWAQRKQDGWKPPADSAAALFGDDDVAF